MQWLEFVLSLALPHDSSPMPRRMIRPLDQTEQVQYHPSKGMGCKKGCGVHNFACCSSG
jgi:hypothetical protein